MKSLNIRIVYVTALLVGAATGCGSDDPADVAGSYTIAVTNGDNGCEFPNYTEGDSASGITMAITQDGSDVTADLSGVGVAGFFDLILGSHTFTGSVDGSDLSLKIVGTRAASSGNCTYTLNANVSATLDGDFLSGTIDYTPATNGGSDCGTKNSCHTRQSFNGTRPPATN